MTMTSMRMTVAMLRMSKGDKANSSGVVMAIL
jgi:hypothetical protein